MKLKEVKDMSTPELLAEYNERAGKQVKKWSKKRTELEERVEALRPKPRAKAEDGEKKPRGRGIGAFCRQAIADGLDTDAILAAVAERFEGAATTRRCVDWYRAKMKKEGLI